MIILLWVKLCAGLVQRVLVVVAKHFKQHGIVTQVVNKGGSHWHTNLYSSGMDQWSNYTNVLMYMYILHSSMW